MPSPGLAVVARPEGHCEEGNCLIRSARQAGRDAHNQLRQETINFTVKLTALWILMVSITGSLLKPAQPASGTHPSITCFLELTFKRPCRNALRNLQQAH